MKGIIFDFNGTLFFDSHMHYEAWRIFSKKLRGYEFTDDEMREKMFGRTNSDIIEYAIGKNRHLNIEFISESKFSIFEMFEDRKARKDFYSYDLQILNDRIRRFYGTYETIS